LQEGQYEITVPTIGDRIAQTAVAMTLESTVDPVFHNDSYGYRPGKSALDAVEVCKQRCWRHPWIVDLDIQGFLDAWSYCSVR
jgi:RNA-directed DNA polymerase